MYMQFLLYAFILYCEQAVYITYILVFIYTFNEYGIPLLVPLFVLHNFCLYHIHRIPMPETRSSKP